tara:strand:- start:511 stop:1002 length:492 start_codon:yes stop_codon:yes gene_type:complete
VKSFPTKFPEKNLALRLTALLLLVLSAFPKIVITEDSETFTVNVPSYSILMTDKLENKNPTKNFSCTKPVYLYFTWYLLDNIHEVTAFWINPQGKEENQARLKFYAKQKKTNNWVALEFKNIFNEKNPIAPSLKASRLSGKWKVRVLLDGNLLETLNFNVLCG